MKRFLIFVLPLLFLFGCGGSKADLSTPEKTFETMVQAIHDKDIETYTACWYSFKAAMEGQVASLSVRPETWDALARSFPKGTKVFGRREISEKGMTLVEFDVPVSNGVGGLDTTSVSLTQENGDWKMWHW